MSRIVTRSYNPETASRLGASGLSPLMARIYAARGVADASELDASLKRLLPYHSLKNITAAACRLADAIERQEKLLIVADYDSDGATADAQRHPVAHVARRVSPRAAAARIDAARARA